MYTSYIGKRFLEIYNKKTNENLSPEDFFKLEVFEKFYNHPKYFKWIVNSPFVQKLGKEDKSKISNFKEEQTIKLKRLINKIKNEIPDSSFAIGYPSSDITFDTSGQVSNLELNLSKDDLYYSWIGVGLGIEVEGKQVWYIDKDEILWTIFKGWDEYRKYLNDVSLSLKGNEIELWNTVWLNYYYDNDKISPKLIITQFMQKNSSGKKDSQFSINSFSWISMTFLLTRIYPNEKLIIFSSRFIYDKQKYVTIGFIQLNTTEILRFNKFFNIVFHRRETLSNRELRKLYETKMSFQRACELGVIGLRAIEPKDLRKYMPSRYEKKFPKLKNDENSIIKYSIYITWIIAMLNNKELLELAEKSAAKLNEFISRDQKKSSMKRTNIVQSFLGSKNRKDFVESLTVIAKEDGSMTDISNELVNKIMLDIAPDNITLFVTLLRFKYLSNNI